jgi:hypothetical protein
MKKILCIGASQCLPRKEVEYEDTWFYLLKQKYNEHEFIDYFTRALLMPQTKTLFEQYYRCYKPNLVIWESGMTDCAPRIIVEKKWYWHWIISVSKSLHFESVFWTIAKMVFKRSPNRVYTPIEDFEKYAEILIRNFIGIGVEKIILLQIEPIGTLAQNKSPYWMNNIDRYNKVYRKLSEKYFDKVVLISPKKDATDDCYIEDGYHPNKKGMQMTYNGIDSVLMPLIRE